MRREIDRRLSRIESATKPNAEMFLLCRKHETPDDALARCRAEGRTTAERMLIGWEELSAEEWEAKYCLGESMFQNVDRWMEESEC